MASVKNSIKSLYTKLAFRGLIQWVRELRLEGVTSGQLPTIAASREGESACPPHFLAAKFLLARRRMRQSVRETWRVKERKEKKGQANTSTVMYANARPAHTLSDNLSNLPPKLPFSRFSAASTEVPHAKRSFQNFERRGRIRCFRMEYTKNKVNSRQSLLHSENRAKESESLLTVLVDFPNLYVRPSLLRRQSMPGFCRPYNHRVRNINTDHSFLDTKKSFSESYHNICSHIKKKGCSLIEIKYFKMTPSSDPTSEGQKGRWVQQGRTCVGVGEGNNHRKRR